MKPKNKKEKYICNCVCHTDGSAEQAGTSCDNCYQVHFLTVEEVRKNKNNKLVKKYLLTAKEVWKNCGCLCCELGVYKCIHTQLQVSCLCKNKPKKKKIDYIGRQAILGGGGGEPKKEKKCEHGILKTLAENYCVKCNMPKQDKSTDNKTREVNIKKEIDKLWETNFTKEDLIELCDEIYNLGWNDSVKSKNITISILMEKIEKLKKEFPAI